MDRKDSTVLCKCSRPLTLFVWFLGALSVQVTVSRCDKEIGRDNMMSKRCNVANEIYESCMMKVAGHIVITSSLMWSQFWTSLWRRSCLSSSPTKNLTMSKVKVNWSMCARVRVCMAYACIHIVWYIRVHMHILHTYIAVKLEKS